jgi:hypothetical protein
MNPLRAHVASLCMAALLGPDTQHADEINEASGRPPEALATAIARDAVMFADALINELQKEPQ